MTAQSPVGSLSAVLVNTAKPTVAFRSVKRRLANGLEMELSIRQMHSDPVPILVGEPRASALCQRIRTVVERLGLVEEA